MDSFLNFWSIQGASLAITRNDSLLYARGYGICDDGVPMTADVRMRMASVSKLLTAVGIMRLQEEGKVFLETPVFGPFGVLNEYDRYIRDEQYYGITVEHLLRHQAGFTLVNGDVMFRTREFMRKWGLSKPPTADILLQKELQKPLAFEPGTSQEYSNFGYLLLSLIIEKVSGLPYGEYMQKEVFEPILCHHFALGGDYLKDRLPDETRYYMQADAETVTSFDGRFADVDKCYGGNHISGLLGAGGWIGTAPELARLVASVDGFGTVPDILNPESVGQMTTYFDPDTYGLGWVDCKPDGELTRTGSFSGTAALVKVYPDGECWILLCNTSAWRGSRFTNNIAALFNNLRGRFSRDLPVRDLFRSEPT
ncbi:MAG: beta-lactamase family protein [Bacteroidales bacterium]|nr:beta-lactamase family protein [Bacteroidales bacterium]